MRSCENSATGVSAAAVPEESISASNATARLILKSGVVAALFPPFGQAPLTRPVVGVIGGIDLAHRRLPRPLLVRVRDQAWQPRDQEDRIAQLVREPEVGADRRDR